MKKEATTKADTKTIVRKVFSVLGNVALCLFVALAVFVLVVTVTAKKDSDGTATIFGKQLRFVQSGSMEKCDQTDVSAYKIKSIKVKSCIFIDVIPEDEAEREEWLKSVKVGDVLTFKYMYTKQETITHRVIAIEEKETGGYIITLEGDNKVSETNVGQQKIDTSDTNSYNYIIGRVTGQSYILGLLVYALNKPVGIVCFVIVPCIVMIGFQVMRIIRTVNAGKKEKVAKEKESQANEIEELRRQLESLKQSVVTDAQPQEDAQADNAEANPQANNQADNIDACTHACEEQSAPASEEQTASTAGQGEE